MSTARDRWVQKAQELGALYVLGPTAGASTLEDLSTYARGVAELKNGATLSASGLVDGGAAAVLDGTDDYIDTLWATRTNLVTNPSFEIDLAGWTSAGTPTTRERTTSEAHDGAASQKIVMDEANEGAVTVPSMTTTVSKTYTASSYVKAPVGTKVQIRLEERTAADAEVGLSIGEVIATGGWDRVSVSRAFGATGAKARIRVICTTPVTFYFDDVLLEQSGVVSEYFPTVAQLESGLAGWSGTAHESASDIGPFARGTARTFVGFANRTESATDDSFFGGTDATSPFLWCSAAGNTMQWQAQHGAGSPTTYVGAWPGNGLTTSFAQTFDGVTKLAGLYINGLLKEEVAHANIFSGKGRLIIGGIEPGTAIWVGSMLPFAVFPKSLSAAEVYSFTEALAEPAVPSNTPPVVPVSRMWPHVRF